MDIQAEKLKAIEKLLKTRNENLIQKINTLLNEAILKPMTKEELEEKLKRSEKDIKEGKVYSHQEALNYFKNKSQ